jgi:hypothetical protein
MVDTTLPTTPLTEANVGMGIGASELPTSDMVLNIGPQHPSTHGVLRLALTIDGERIVRAEPIIGYMHRGHEKLFEARDYRQIIVLANRFDWLSSFANEIGFVLAVERMMGLETPDRALWSAPSRPSSTRSASGRRCSGSWRRSPAAGCTTCSTGWAASRRTCPPGGKTVAGSPSPTCASG